MKIRSIHRKISLYLIAPIGVIIISGLFLQFRNQFEWIQPQLVQGEVGNGQVLGPKDLIEQHQLNETDVEQIIYKLSKTNVSIRMKSGEEIQLDPSTGKLLKKAMRRTNLFIDIHQGSLFGPFGQYGIYLFTGFGLILLYISGISLLIPKRKK